MVQQLLPLLPKDLGQAALIAALVGTFIGAGLWLVGSRFSRPMITLLTVSLGAILGRSLPGWMNWNVNTMAASVGCAVALGMSGFVMHRVWVGMGFGLLLACWAAIGVWVFAGPGAELTWPAVDATTTWQSLGQTFWACLPEKVRTLLPFACGGAMLSGFLSSLLWPRVAVVTLYSALGTSLLVGLGLIAIENRRPEWITIVPSQTWAQVASLLGIVAFGAIIQWQMMGGKKPGARSQEPA
jgi:hypothetical protein